MDPGWYAQLVGDTNYLRDLSDYFSGPGLRIFKEGSEFYLSSTSFDSFGDSVEVRGAAVELVAVACGIAETELGPFLRPSVGSIRRVDPSGHEEQIVHVGAAQARLAWEQAVRLFPGIPRPSRPEPQPPPTNEWADLALANEDVRDVLAILGREDVRWHDLYHVIEIIQADVGSRIYEDGWATRREVDRFTHTANNRGALGREARHGHRRWEPPANPMSFEEALRLVTGIVRMWLRFEAGLGGNRRATRSTETTREESVPAEDG